MIISYWDKLPEEIINIIYQFNPSHRENFNKIKKLLVKKAIFKRCDYIIDIWNNKSIRIPYARHLKNEIDDPELFLKILSNCNCCERHKKNRPNHFQHYWLTNNQDLNLNQVNNNDNHCYCYCRNMSRWIVRMNREYPD